MCPLRLILVFLSATLAGYFAWKTFRSSSEAEGELLGDTKTGEKTSAHGGDGDFGFRKVIEGGFWAFVDMASGRYLWRNLRMKDGQKEKGC
ncbi:uncharacterized protein LOC131222624 [Magnolia sinica]|uniref:uncharacterized protein LOC131222624 n=1 Tax=Magnolia sinica TaxID=86752 RepID=UPI002659E907|nr:uncharacterized protein LOC131222624 [Magnolia sinica]